MATSNKTIAKNTMFLYIRMAIVMVVTFYTSRVILSVLGASDYGIYNVVGGIVTMMAFLNGALSSSSSRFLTYELGTGNIDQLKKTFSASLNLHICVALLVLLVGETIGLWFFYEKLVIPDERMNAAFWVYQFSIITTMVNFTQVPFNASLISHENMSVYAYVGLYEALSKLIIVYLLQIAPFDHLIIYALLLMLNTVGIQMFYRIYTSRKYIECRFQIVKDKVLYKKLLSYSGWDLFGNCAVICQNQGINILLNLFFGPVVNAARAITFQIQGALNQFVNNFLTAVRPQVVKSFAEKDYDSMYNLTYSSMRLSFYLMLCFVTPIIAEIDFLLYIWLGDSCPEQTSTFTIIILISGLFQTIHTAQLMAFHAIGKIKIGNLTGGPIMILALPLSYFALSFGAEAYMVFIIILLVNICVMLNCLFLCYHYIPFDIKEMFKTTYLPIFVIMCTAFIVPIVFNYFLPIGLNRFIMDVLLSEVVLCIIIWMFGMRTNEKKKIVKYIKQKVKLWA